jgi:hypothetical protein
MIAAIDALGLLNAEKKYKIFQTNSLKVFTKAII